MAKNMGEFEERPKVQEATPIPFKRRRPIGWMVATCLFAVIAIAAISFIVFDKVTEKADKCIKDDTVVEGETEDSKKEKSNPDDGVTTGFISTEEFGTLYVTKSGDVYLVPVNSIVGSGETMKKYVRQQDYDSGKAPGEYGKYTLTVDDIADLDKELTINGYKLDIEKAVSVFGPLEFGQAWNGYNYAFVKQDGSFDWLHITPGYKDEETDMKAEALITKNVSDYKEVVSIINAQKDGYRSVMIILKDGSQEWLSGDLLSKLEGF